LIRVEVALVDVVVNVVVNGDGDVLDGRPSARNAEHVAVAVAVNDHVHVHDARCFKLMAL